MSKLLRLAAGEDAHAILDHVLSAGSLDEGGRDQVLGGELEVAVVLEHASELEVLWITFSVKGGEVLVLKRFRDLHHAVGPGEGSDSRKAREEKAEVSREGRRARREAGRGRGGTEGA